MAVAVEGDVIEEHRIFFRRPWPFLHLHEISLESMSGNGGSQQEQNTETRFQWMVFFWGESKWLIYIKREEGKKNKGKLKQRVLGFEAS